MTKFKDCALARPLGEDSAHHPKLHRTWPIAVLRSAMAACTRDDDRVKIKMEWVGRFKRFGASKALLNALEETTVCTAVCNKACAGRPIWWCVLPYHPRLHKGLTRTVETFNQDVAMKSCWLNASDGLAPLIKIAWRYQLPSLLDLVRHRKGGWQGS